MRHSPHPLLQPPQWGGRRLAGALWLGSLPKLVEQCASIHKMNEPVTGAYRQTLPMPERPALFVLYFFGRTRNMAVVTEALLS
jgi:hypothetical protein